MTTDKTITIKYATKLTAHQLDTAIRLAALLHGEEPLFLGRLAKQAQLQITGTGLTMPVTVLYQNCAVVINFSEHDAGMLKCIRSILDDKLMSEVAIVLEASRDKRDFERAIA